MRHSPIKARLLSGRVIDQKELRMITIEATVFRVGDIDTV
jgi:hypothetical protein